MDSIRFRSVLPFDKGEREEFVSVIWNDVTDRWGADFTPEIEAILSGTCGEILYNEQVCAIATLVGYFPCESVEFCKVLTKRKKQEYNNHRRRFSRHKGLFQKLINEGGWSFPKAVTAEFARLVYLTAYLKTHFPEEFTRAALCVAASEDC